MKFVLIVLTLVLLSFCSASPLPRKTRNVRTHGNFGPKVKQTFEIKPEALFQSSLLNNDPVEISKLHIALESKVDVSAIRVTASHKNDKNGITHVYLQQVINALDVVNAVANVNVNGQGKIVSAGNGFYKNDAPAADFSRFIKLTAADAVIALAKYLKLNIPTELATSEVNVGETLSYTVSGASFALSDIPADLKYIQVEEGSQVTLVWDLRVEMKDNMYNAFIDTTTGEVISLIDWVTDATYNVYPFGISDPNHGNRAQVVHPAHPVASPLGWHSQAEGEEFTDTIGNNVFAQNNPDGGTDYVDNHRPDGGSNHIFDFPIDLTKQPAEYIDASITNAFYMNNIIHDLFYVYGFDEKAGNFQHNNFGNGGEENDAVVVFVQDGSGTNNANFMTPPDGGNGRMRMFVWTMTDPRRDGDLDAGIVIHEFGHGISTRLTGGPSNVGCLGWSESGGMGEGWGDWFAVITRTNVSSTRNDDFAVGAYSMNNNVGVRKYMYSTSLETNPTTYGYLTEYWENHDIGEVWAAILYEVYWNLVDKNGYDPDWFNVNSTGGNVKALQLVVDGMKLQPCFPSFVNARDAIIQADEINNGGDNFCELWRGFAKRGLGVNAVAGGDDWEWVGVENFDVPQSCA